MSFYFYSLAQYKHYFKQIIKNIVINFFWIFFSHQNRKISKWYLNLKGFKEAEIQRVQPSSPALTGCCNINYN